MAITIYDVAKLAKVAPSTVSKYINHGVLRKEVRKRVESAINELNYSPNMLARGLKVAKSYSVGIIIPTLDSSFSAQIISAIETALYNYGYGVLVCDCEGLRSIEIERLHFLNNKVVDSFIILPSGINSSDLQDIAKPVVLFDKPIKDYSADLVYVDNFKAGYQGTKVAIDKGHTDIAIIAGGKNVYTSDERIRGYLSALKDHQVEVKDENIIHTDFTLEDSYHKVMDLLSRKNLPTCIFAINADTTSASLMAINKMKIDMPEQISMVGFDNLTISQIANPSLTIVYQPLKEIGYEIAKIVIKRLQGDPSPKTEKMLDCILVEGNSVKECSRQ
ncbi:MAG: LacI family transcriptional regulator [Acholeplasmataceae bacterium]|jgi:DNA-binding LacI/PurR family transcriptional regulator|nr:LacI family transcriptional regulator [Acholeplasmataceae bacterium]